MAVVLFHFGQVKLAAGLAPHAYLAVDFFFILSGFVIAYTYEASIASGTMSLANFLLRRAIRLYPLAVLGVGMAAVVLGLKLRIDPSKVDPAGRLAAGVAVNLFLLPDFFGGPATEGVLFPGDGVLWSVCLEVGINVAWCLLLVRVNATKLAALVSACFAIFAVAVVGKGTANLGFDWATLPAGMARIGYGFGLGILICRNRARFAKARRGNFKISAIVLLAATLFGPITSPTFSALFDLAAVGILLPLVLLLGMNATDHSRFDTPLGEMSYPLYAIHFPILLAASGLHQKFPAVEGMPLLVGVPAVLALITWLALVAYDRPVRRALMQWSGKRVPGRAVVSLRRLLGLSVVPDIPMRKDGSAGQR